MLIIVILLKKIIMEKLSHLLFSCVVHRITKLTTSMSLSSPARSSIDTSRSRRTDPYVIRNIRGRNNNQIKCIEYTWLGTGLLVRLSLL